MPQLDLASYPSQLFWLAITFFALLFIISRVALPKIGSVLQDRQQTIGNDLDGAAKSKDEAESLEKEYHVALAKTRAKASEKISKAHADVNELSAQEHGELDKVLSKQAAEASEKINNSRDVALGEIATVSAVLASEIVEKLSGVKVDAKDAEKTVSKIIG
jgi:F-type H+-transporting ATPase subunit b